MSNKTEYKNWVEGDTFAVKIENIDPKYDGQYIILIKCDKLEVREWDSGRKLNTPFFYAKITTNYRIPKNITELNSLTFIKVKQHDWETRYLPYSGMETYEELKKRKKHLKFYPDEFMYLYSYVIMIWLNRRFSYKEFNFIGNYKIEFPEDEYIADYPKLLMIDKNDQYNYFVTHLLKTYEWYNNRQHFIYTKEGIEKMAEENKKTVASRKIDDLNTIHYRKTGKFLSKDKIQRLIDDEL